MKTDRKYGREDTMMKRILMVCNSFAPDNRIAAIRITKFAKYFKEHGYEVTVISENKESGIEDDILKKDAEGIRTIRISNSECVKKVVSIYNKIITPAKQKRFSNLDNRMRINKKTKKYEFYPFETAYPVIGSLDYLIGLLRQYDLCCKAKPYLKDLENLSYIFTSYGDYFGVFMGMYMHKKYKKVPWIADFRDTIYQRRFTPKYVKGVAKGIENYVWRKADCIIEASKGDCQAVPKKYWKKLHCVTNGFDRGERENIVIENEEHGKLRFVYTGGMYGGMRDLSPVFRSVKVLADKKEIDLDKIEFCYAGKESAYEVFTSQAQKYGIDDRCVYCGCITRKEALKLQMESDILLVASWNSKEEKGALTGKALEYMSANKPIIAIVNGDVPNSELGEIIHDARLGFAYEEADFEKSNTGLCQYLVEKYCEFINNGRLEHNPDEKILRKFDYRYLGKRMLGIMEGSRH